MKIKKVFLFYLGFVISTLLLAVPSAGAKDRLIATEWLRSNQYLLSNNGAYKLLMQGDGNLVLSRVVDDVALWTTNTHGRPGAEAVMQSDGNFVVYYNSSPIWATNTPGTYGQSILKLQSDGNLVLASPTDVALWHSGTVVHPEANVTEFGIYHTGWGLEAGDVSAVSAVAPYSTFVDVVYNRTDIMVAAKDKNLKLWIDLAPIFFDGSANKRADYVARWNAEKVQFESYSDIIYAFEPLDEAYSRSPMPDADLKSYLEDIADLLQADFPNARRALTFTATTVNVMALNYFYTGNPGLLPNKWNLLGVDNYAGDNFTADTASQLIYATSNFDNNINYYLIPRAFLAPGYPNLSQQQLIKRARQAVQFANTQPRVIALRPFLWRGSSNTGTGGFVGVRDLPELRHEYEVLGGFIK